MMKNFSRTAKWGVLIFLSALFAAFFTWVRLPAALLLGPMMAAILVENMGANIQLPPILFYCSQGVIGCMIARAITPETIHSFLQQWPLFLGIGILVIVMGCTLGWIISKLRILPETTAIWGLLPGAASAMMIMADLYGADPRLVAFMQYLRIVIVALLASVISCVWGHATSIAGVTPPTLVWFPLLLWQPFTATLAIIMIGMIIGKLMRLPAGMLIVPMLLGATLQATGLVEIELPRWLLALCFLFLGWNVGLRFTRQMLVYALSVLPQIIFSILTMILFCGGLAFALVKFHGVDPLTAYLATSPGGVDSVTIIATSTQVDVGFVIALQITRALLVIMIGPILSKFLADRI